jgi:hypothetical protein
MTIRIARRLCEHGGRDGFLLGRQILEGGREVFGNLEGEE